MRVAVVGGTGKFGKALALRLEDAGYEVVVGSRDAQRAAAVAGELGVDGLTNEEAARSADFIVLATNADAALATAEQLREAIGDTPLLCVASELQFTPGGVLPGPDGLSLAERVQATVRGSGRRGLALARRPLARWGGGAGRGRARLRRRRRRRSSRSSSPDASPAAARSTRARLPAPVRSRA